MQERKSTANKPWQSAAPIKRKDAGEDVPVGPGHDPQTDQGTAMRRPDKSPDRAFIWPGEAPLHQIVPLCSAKRFNDSSHALDRQGGHQQPKQQCLENARHAVSLARWQFSRFSIVKL